MTTSESQPGPTAEEEFSRLVDDKLRRLVGERGVEDRATPATASTLVHDAYRELTGGQHIPWSRRRYFFLAAAHAVRRIQVETARHATDRGRGSRPDSGENSDSLLGHDARDVLALDRALRRLERVDAMAYEIVHLRYFAGVTLDKIARALGVPFATIESRWSFAKAFLRGEMLRILGSTEGAADEDP